MKERDNNQCSTESVSFVPCEDGAALKIALRSLLDTRVSLDERWVVTIRRPDARHDEKSHFDIDLEKYWLPANGVYPTARRLSDHPPFAAATTLVLDAYSRRAVSEKMYIKRCQHFVAILAKFFEYLWLHNVFAVSAVPTNMWLELIQSVGAGGWQNALKIGPRLKAWVCSGGQAHTLVSGYGKETGIVTKKFTAALGTNATGQVTAMYLPLLVALTSEDDLDAINEAFDALVETEDETGNQATISRSSLREIMTALNYLFDLKLAVGSDIYPYSDIQGIARRYGSPPGRTKNLGVAEAGLLLSESVQWIYQIGPKLIDLVELLCGHVEHSFREGRVVLGHNLEEILTASLLSSELNSLLPSPIVRLDSPRNEVHRLTVRGAILFLHTAVFIVVAAMNARRRDEVVHRKFGIHQAFISVLDDELNLYQAEFYVEKSYLDYVPFYVNRITVDACSLLERLQKAYDRVDQTLGHRIIDNIPVRERTLFAYRRMSRIAGVGKELCWYEFDVTRGAARQFVELALGPKVKIKPHPHMFRRFYALVYYYQYSNARLQALSQQMGHRALLSTMTYISDNTSRKEGERIRDIVGRDKAAIQQENKALQIQLDLVGDELLYDTILEIVEGKPVSGGYPRYVRHVHKLLAKHVEFSDASMREISKKILQLVKSRGHKPQSMRHGQCNSGDSTSTHLAACKATSGELQKELASARTCSKCPFHSFNMGYLQALRSDMESTQSRANECVGIERKALMRSVEETEKVIVLHMRSMGLREEV